MSVAGWRGSIQIRILHTAPPSGMGANMGQRKTLLCLSKQFLRPDFLPAGK